MIQTLRKATAFDIFRLIFISAIWGGSFIFIALALEVFGPLSIVAIRVVLATLVLIGVSFLTRQAFSKSYSDWKKFFVIGFLNSAFPFFLINWGQQTISTAESSLLMATTTFCALIFSHLYISDEKINKARGLGVFIGFLGVAVLLLADLMQANLSSLQGQLAVMIAAASYAIASVMGRRISHLPPIPCSAAIMFSTCFYMIPLALIFEQPFAVKLTTTAIVSVLFLGIVATALTFVLRFTIVRDNGVIFLSQVGYLIPLFGVLWSWLFLSEIISTQTWIALVLIIIGIAITRQGHKTIKAKTT